MNRHDFLLLYFSVANLSKEYIFAGKMVAVIFICGNLFLRMAGKIAKIRTRRNFVPHSGPCTAFSQCLSVNSLR